MTKTKEEVQNPIAGYELIIPAEFYTLSQVFDFMWKYCKRWCFQLEEGVLDNHYRHYQCRISLMSKKRFGTMCKWIQTTLPKAHVLPTNNTCFFEGDDMYVMKEDTRIEGPWSDKTETNPLSIPTRFRNPNPVWRPMQAKIRKLNERQPDDRTINLVKCVDGNQGKSFLVGWECVHKIANKIPPQDSARDIMRCILKMPKRRVYYIDLPRATCDKAQCAIYAAIEELKNGYAFDDRYDWHEEWFEPPHVWVFTNVDPPMNLLSRDRWRLWHIVDQEMIKGLPMRIGELPNNDGGLRPKRSRRPAPRG